MKRNARSDKPLILLLMFWKGWKCGKGDEDVERTGKIYTS